MRVTKANGEIADFDPEKIRRSFRRVHAVPDVIETVIKKIEQKIYDKVPTSELYRIVFRELKTLQRPAAGKYNLKRAIMQLGPTGFPFEKFVAALFESDGFRTVTGQIVKGHCVSHEVDVIAEKDDLHYHAECKFHAVQGKACDVKTALSCRSLLEFFTRFSACC